MCPKKSVTPHSGSVAGRTNLSRSQQATHLQEKVKGRRRVLPHPARPHRVQRTDLPYFCGGVRNTRVASKLDVNLTNIMLQFQFQYLMLKRAVTAVLQYGE
ncbi:hypothetical protein AVEN_252419-1 [Araneus ventricosus]|uniref:Uncharacterized protein n=1 Tax=Araneus ventricosus TaxID=182803 RepID=A0A4Y2ATC5_ARAVE|nr:hypothetical protein AVEN_252419-1 [Araneus ventricosus]